VCLNYRDGEQDAKKDISSYIFVRTTSRAITKSHFHKYQQHFQAQLIRSSTSVSTVREPDDRLELNSSKVSSLDNRILSTHLDIIKTEVV
jgi:hypothetical protein